VAWRVRAERRLGRVIRVPSPRNPIRRNRGCASAPTAGGRGLHSLPERGTRRENRAIRESHEQRLKKDLGKLQARIEKGQLQEEKKIHQAIGRLQERYPRVARYYRMDYQAEGKTLTWQEDSEKKTIAEKLDGGYVLKTDRQDLTAEEIWRTYILLTAGGGGLPGDESPLLERPIFHHLEKRTQTHIFLCVLAYHLLVAIEKALWIGACTPLGGPCANN